MSRRDPSQVERLMRPRSVAIVGITSRPGSAGLGMLECLKINNFSGAIHLVSRSAESIEGLRCVAGVDDLPEGVDLAVFTLPAAAVGEAVAACVRRRVGAALIFAAGFAETGDRGVQERMSRIARDGGLALVGPNCQGFINNVDGLALQMFLSIKAKRFTPRSEPGMALVGQSGGMLSHLRRAAEARGTPISYVVSTGNEAGLDLVDFTAYLVEDAATRVIVLYAEQIRRPREFLAACNRARDAGKSVVLLHGGRGARAQRAVQSHTGAMVGDFGAMRTMVGDAGVLIVDTLDELLDASDLLVRYPEPPTAGPAVITASGAFAALTNDISESLGLDIPAVSETTEAILKQVLPDFVVAANPVDILVSNTEGVTAAARALLEDPNIGSLFIFFPMDGKLGVVALESFLKAVEGSRKPVLAAAWGDTSRLLPKVLRAAKKSRIVFLRSPDRCLRAIAIVTAYGRSLARPRKASPQAMFTGLPALGNGSQPEWLGKKLLAAAGIRVPGGALARTADEAVAVALRVGFPVAVKAQAAALTHKTEAGGVLLGVADEGALRSAWGKLMDNLARAQPGLVLDGVLVEAMATRGVELMVGAKRDPAWGPVLLLGLGGVWVEAMGDARLLPPDATQERIVEELLRLRSAKLLTGFRGSPAADLEAVARAAASIGTLMLAVPEIIEIDVNPLVAHPRGQGVTALDALIVTE